MEFKCLKLALDAKNVYKIDPIDLNIMRVDISTITSVYRTWLENVSRILYRVQC